MKGKKMKKEFHINNRTRLYSNIKEPSIIIMYSGSALRKTADEILFLLTEILYT